MEILRDPYMICLEMEEVVNLYRAEKMPQLLREVIKSGSSFWETYTDKIKLKNVVDRLVAKNMKNKSEIELFSAMTFTEMYFPKGSKVCVPLKNSFNHTRDTVLSFEDLKQAMKENTLTDFGVLLEGKKLVSYQLKRYIDSLETEPFFDFISSQLKKYGNNLGNVNMLIILSPKSGRATDTIDYKKLFDLIKGLNLKFEGEIFVLYNEERKFNVMCQVYPKLLSIKKVIDSRYPAGKSMYQ